MILTLGCKEEKDEGQALPAGGSDCVSSDAEPTSTNGFVSLKVSGDYSGEVTYICFKLSTLKNGDTNTSESNGVKPDIGVIFNDNNTGAFSDTVHFSLSLFKGFYEGLSTFQICPPSAGDDTQGIAHVALKIRTPKLDNKDQTTSSYDVWLHNRCDDDSIRKVYLDSHDVDTNRVTGSFDEIKLRTDDKSKKVSVSGSFSFLYQDAT